MPFLGRTDYGGSFNAYYEALSGLGAAYVRYAPWFPNPRVSDSQSKHIFVAHLYHSVIRSYLIHTHARSLFQSSRHPIVPLLRRLPIGTAPCSTASCATSWPPSAGRGRSRDSANSRLSSSSPPCRGDPFTVVMTDCSSLPYIHAPSFAFMHHHLHLCTVICIHAPSFACMHAAGSMWAATAPTPARAACPSIRGTPPTHSTSKAHVPS